MQEDKREARQRADEFHEQLRRATRRLPPEQFGPALAQKLHSVLEDPNQWTHFAPHFLVQAIEANCAYFDPRYTSDPVNAARLVAVLNLLIKYRDPYLKYALEQLKDLELFALAMARQQFLYQRTADDADAGRAIVLFLNNSRMRGSARAFERRCGFEMKYWIWLCLAVLRQTNARRTPLIDARWFDAVAPAPAAAGFLKYSSAAPEEVRDRFEESRKGVPSHLHIFLPSVFVNCPMIRYRNGACLVVHPGLMMRHALYGLYRECESADSEVFHREFGRAFEDYVAQLLTQLAPQAKVTTESQLAGISQGRVCDFVLDCRDCILLVECKGVMYSSTLLTKEAIRNDNSTGKLADSFEQLQQTAARIRAGEVPWIAGYESKPFYALTITLGELYFADAPYYVREYVMPRVHRQSSDAWPAPLQCVPQVISIDTLEATIAVSKSAGVSIGDIFVARLSGEYDKMGDWNVFLKNKYGRKESYLSPQLEQAVVGLLAQLRAESKNGESSGPAKAQ